MPRLLEDAGPVERATMLARLPAPVRLLDRIVFEPGHRRTRAALPAARR